MRLKHLLHIGNPRGAAMAEVIVAILILSAGSISALSLMNSILQMSTSSNNRIIATNLAREGIEAVRNIRDSNWLLYSGSQRDTNASTRDHWNDGFDVPIGLPDTEQIVRYRIYLARSGSGLIWTMEADYPDATHQSDDPATIMSDSYYQLLLDDTTIDAAGNTKTIYNYTGLGGTATNYYRQIKVTYLNSYDDISPAPQDADLDDNIVLVESKVFWTQSSGTTSVELNTILTDWYGRNDHVT